MLPQFDSQMQSEAAARLLEFAGALAVINGAMAWWRKGSEEEDQMTVAAHDTVLDALSNADATRTVDAVTGKNWRDQVSVEEAQALQEERGLRAFGFRRN